MFFIMTSRRRTLLLINRKSSSKKRKGKMEQNNRSKLIMILKNRENSTRDSGFLLVTTSSGYGVTIERCYTRCCRLLDNTKARTTNNKLVTTLNFGMSVLSRACISVYKITKRGTPHYTGRSNNKCSRFLSENLVVSFVKKNSSKY